MIQGLWLSQVFAFISILILANLEPMLSLMGYEQEVIGIASDYLKALCWGIPFVLAFNVLRMFSEGLSIYVLMFGHFGFPAMGTVGAGWATSMVYCVMFCAMLAFCLKE